jgi:hypothetical protein
MGNLLLNHHEGRHGDGLAYLCIAFIELDLSLLQLFIDYEQ